MQDPLGALAQDMAPNAAVQSYWQEAWKNATTVGSTYTYLSTSAGSSLVMYTFASSALHGKAMAQCPGWGSPLGREGGIYRGFAYWQ